MAVVSTRRDQHDLMREELSIRAAYEALAFSYEVRRRIDPFIHAHRPDARLDWEAAARLADTAEADGQRFAEFMAVIRPMKIVDHLAWLWEELENAHYDNLLDSVVANRDRSGLDDWARNIGQGLTNLLGELDAYLRSDLEEREIARRPIWRRYRFQRRPPFVCKVRLLQLVDRDPNGDAKAYY
jgi:hypothetical protein